MVIYGFLINPLTPTESDLEAASRGASGDIPSPLGERARVRGEQLYLIALPARTALSGW